MKVGLFIPCYVNAAYPEVGVATYKLLKHFECDVEYPIDQTCCGQPMGNAGFEEKSKPLAKNYSQLFKEYDYIVAPSGSCVDFVRDHYPEISGDDKEVVEIAKKTFDLCEFLHDILKIDKLPGSFNHKISLHNSCHGLRVLKLGSASELNITPFSKVKSLLSLVQGVEVLDSATSDECCGFGGMFSVEEPAVSICMGVDKVNSHIANGSEFIVGPDSSCLMHMQGIIDKNKLPIKTIHVAQILATGL